MKPHPEHIGPGILPTAGAGPSTNGSQYFVDTTKPGWSDKQAVFGKVLWKPRSALGPGTPDRHWHLSNP